MKKKKDLKSGKIRIECPDDAMVEIYRKKSPMERVKIASDMWDSAWLQVSAILRSMHPDWSDSEINKAVIRRLSHENL